MTDKPDADSPAGSGKRHPSGGLTTWLNRASSRGRCRPGAVAVLILAAAAVLCLSAAALALSYEVLHSFTGSSYGGAPFAGLVRATDSNFSSKPGVLRLARQTGTATQSVTSSEGLYDGNWSGTTDQGKTISFTIVNNSVAVFSIGYLTSVGPCQQNSSVTFTYNPPQPFTGSTFSIEEIHTPGLSVAAAGIFDSSTSAYGAASFVFSQASPACISDGSTSWTATTSTPSTGFSGKVTDAGTGAGISGASVTWGSFTTTTDGSGNYNLNSLPCQTNALTVSKSGYQTSSQSYTPTCNTTSNVKNVPLTASPSSLPNLAPYQPPGWSGKIVVSKTAGTNSDSSPLAPTDPLYVDWAVVNDGTAPTGARFYTELYVDGGLRQSWYTDPPLNANTYTALLDYPIGSLSAGTHSIKIKTDATGAIAERDEGDNEYTKTVTVGSPSSTGFSGKVTDTATGAGISGAAVSWGSFSATSDGSGNYSLNSLPCQTNTLTVSKPGYQTSSQSYTPTCNTTSNVKNVPLTASQAQQVTFNFVGAPQTWAVPPGVTSVAVDARGAQGGGNSGDPLVQGGKGGRVQATLAVTPGETLVIYVAGRGGDLIGPNTAGPGGFNGGGASGIDNVDFNGPAGGGGGASDVRQGGDGFAYRVVVAGGGGGAECCEDANGGDGGGATGISGGTSGHGSAPGGGGTQSSGGAGGGGCPGNGSSGSLGQGGVGGNGNRAGGGGGGGYYGGGGGGGCFLGSGGGGGSSNSAGTSTIHTQGYQTGAGQVVIAYSGPPAPVVPAVPTNLLAVALSASTTNLTWPDNSGNETGFKIERKTGIAGTYTQIGIQAQNLNFFNDSGLTASTQYCYRVRATNTAGDSAYSNESCATTQAPPSPPGSFTLTGNAYCNTAPPAAPAVKLNWTASGGATNYVVYRNQSAYSGSLPSTQLSYDNQANVVAGQTYIYLIRAINATGATDSNAITVAVPSNVCGTCSLTCAATVPSTSAANVSVEFQASATPSDCTGSPTYDWDFGDGSPHSAQQNPSHAYAAAGTYGWTMAASIPTAAACVRTGVITVTQITSCYPLSVGAYPVGAGTASASTPPNCTGGYRGGTTVSLTATPAAGYAFASWSGSGGSFAAVSSPNTTFTIIGSAFVAANFTRNPRPPTVIFSYSPINPRVGETVKFSDTSVDFPTSWSWDFDGDGLADASTRNPVHVFTAPGAFMVTLRATNSSGSSSVTKEIDVSPATSVLEIVDPNPSLLSSTGALVEDSDLLSGTASLVHGAAADGVTLLLLRSTVSGPGQVTFSLSSGNAPNDGGLSPVATIGPRGRLNSVTVPVNETPSGSGVFRAFAVYEVPDDFISPQRFGTSDELQAHRTLAFSAVFTPTSGSPATSPPVAFNLVRPPLVLLHGIWSSAATWTFPLRTDYRWTLNSIWDYADTSAAGFATNLIVPFRAIRDALTKARGLGIAATQVDVVSHSMGGILARNWVSSSGYERSDNFERGDIHKLITLDTPHLGSLLANTLIALRDSPIGPIVVDVARRFGMPVDHGAVDDLATGSESILAIQRTAVPSHALLGIGGTALTLSVVPGMASLYTIMRFFGAGDIFGAIQNDLIVGRASQDGGLPGAAVSTPFDGLAGIHTCFGIFPECGNTSSSAYSTEVMQALNTPLGSSWFDYFPATSSVSSLIDRESARPGSRSRITSVTASGLVITSPLAGTKVVSGQTIHVTVQAEANTGVTSVLLGGREVAQVDDAPPFEFDLVIPSTAAGSFELRAVGKSPNGTFYTSDAITLDVVPPGMLTSIEVIPNDVILFGPGATRRLRISGTYSDGVVRDIGNLAGTEFVSSSPEIVSVSAIGVVTARNPGVATVSVTNSSVRKDVSVTVADVPDERFVTAPPHRLRRPRTVEPRP